MTAKLFAKLLLLCFLTGAVTQAAPLRFQISDPLGDNAGRIDLTALTLDFDTTTGAYTITVQASAARPFSGTFRLNINLLNPDTGLGISFGAMLSDRLNDFTFASPSTSAVLTGVDSKLTLWKIGDRVAINSGPFGGPSNAPFNSGVTVFPGSGFDDFGNRLAGAAAVNFATITAAPDESAVPEPSASRLFGSGALLLAAGTRFLRKRRS